MRGKFGKITKFMMCRLCFAACAAALAACAPSQEFQAAPQAGAWRGGGYPSFSARPQAETAQFSEAERQHLSQTLRSDGRRLRNSAAIEDKKQRAAPGAAVAKRQANQEIQKTLRQITGGNSQ